MTSSISTRKQGSIGLVTLNRPERHNAFDNTLVDELTNALRGVEADDSIRAVVIASTGPSFSAGADLKWMRRAAAAPVEENHKDAMALAALMRTLAELRKPTVARVQGAAYGGGVGLVACCDIAVAAPAAKFVLTEVKLGLIPAVISPYVVAAIGPRAAKRYCLSAEPFDAVEAHRLGLVHELAADEADLDRKVDAIVASLLACGPHAQAEVKSLIRLVAGKPVSSELVAETAGRIARLRVTAEAVEGVAAFLEKRQPHWH